MYIHVCAGAYIHVYVVYMCAYIYLYIHVICLYKLQLRFAWNITVFSIVAESFKEIHEIIFNLLWLLLIVFNSLLIISDFVNEEFIFLSSILDASDVSFHTFSVLYELFSVWKSSMNVDILSFRYFQNILSHTMSVRTQKINKKIDKYVYFF